MARKYPTNSSGKSPGNSRHRQILFPILTVTAPLILFLFLEATLRGFGYGPNLNLFLSESINGRSYYIMNPDVKHRYFSKFQFSPTTSSDYFPVTKDSGAFRIFCLGGSTTVGYPYYYNGAFSSFLRDRLRRTFPAKQLEVINLGLTATNSFTVADLAEELMEYEPDLLIVYDGHNEFYGALGFASNESLVAYSWIVKFYLKLIHLKSFLLLRDAYTWTSGLVSNQNSSQQPSGTMMERLATGQYVPYQSDVYNRTRTAFRDNLIALQRFASEHQTAVILSSQISNERDLAPFISRNSEAISRESRSAFDKSFRRGMEHYAMRSDSPAARAFDDALAIDSTFAEAHYYRARCLDRLGRKIEARAAYVSARDYDQLRFRMSSDFNDIISDVGSAAPMYFVDMESAFAAESPDSLIGQSLITEHLHPNARGNFIMARAIVKTMREHALLASAHEWNRADTLPDIELWNSRPLTQLDERIAQRRTQILLSGWPFTAQSPVVDAISPTDTIGQICENIIRARWSWLQGHESAAEYYLSRSDYSLAQNEYRVIINQLPMLNVQYYLRRAKVLLDLHRLPEVREVLIASLAVQPTILAYRALGDIALQRGLATEAVQYYEKTMALSGSPMEQIENGYLLAIAYSREGNTAKSRSQLLKVLLLKPDFQQAIELLSKLKPSRNPD